MPGTKFDTHWSWFNNHHRNLFIIWVPVGDSPLLDSIFTKLCILVVNKYLQGSQVRMRNCDVQKDEPVLWIHVWITVMRVHKPLTAFKLAAAIMRSY